VTVRPYIRVHCDVLETLKKKKKENKKEKFKDEIADNSGPKL
jgi:hypothetical protein